jgi:hypothetical protein
MSHMPHVRCAPYLETIFHGILRSADEFNGPIKYFHLDIMVFTASNQKVPLNPQD